MVGAGLVAEVLLVSFFENEQLDRIPPVRRRPVRGDIPITPAVPPPLSVVGGQRDTVSDHAGFGRSGPEPANKPIPGVIGRGAVEDLCDGCRWFPPYSR